MIYKNVYCRFDNILATCNVIKYVNLFTFTDVIAGRKTLFYAQLCLSKIPVTVKGAALTLLHVDSLVKPSRYSKPLTKEYFLANLNFSLDFDENSSCLPVATLELCLRLPKGIKEALFNCKQQLKLIFAVPVNYPASDWSDLSPLERLVSHSGKNSS